MLEPWGITTADDAVDLKFTPFAVHREDRDLKIVKSHFAQPIGLFEGTLAFEGALHRVEALAGVTEDQDVRW